MTTICRSTSLALLAIAALAGTARAADAPLLVAVEVAPGVDVGPADVRQIVATELGTPVIGTREPTADGASDVLLVGLDRGEIRMSLRAGAGPVVSRTISAPPDRPGRLRSIGWLAGNLVRDQVGPIVAAPQSPPPPIEARAATEPPALPETAAPSNSIGPAAVVSSLAATRSDALPHATWIVTAAGGFGTSVYSVRAGDYYGSQWSSAGEFSRAYQIELQHQTSPESLLFGAALEVGPVYHYFGAAAFAGAGWSRDQWFLEGNLGLGVEVLDQLARTITLTYSSPEAPTVESTTISNEPVPGLYLRGQGIAGVRLSRAFDLVAKLSVHLSSSFDLGSFVSPTIGVRMRLP